MASKRRMYRVAERVQELVATALIHSHDPRLTLVTITSVNLTPDLRVAKVYWMATGGAERRQDIEDGFADCLGTLRSIVARELKIRMAPELRFYYDDSLDLQEHIEGLLKRASDR